MGVQGLGHGRDIFARHQIGHGAATANALHLDLPGLENGREGTDHAWHQDEKTQFLALQNVDQQIRLVAVNDMHRAAAQQCGEGLIGGGHVIERRPGAKIVANGNCHLGGITHGAGHHGPVRDQGALGQARGAGGIENDQTVFGIYLQIGIIGRPRRHEVIVVRAKDQAPVRGQLQAVQRGAQLRLHDHHLRLDEVDAVP